MQLDVARRDDRVLGDVAEVRDLRLHLRLEVFLGAAEQDVGLDAETGELLDAVLRRFRLELAGGLDVRDQRQVHVENVLAAAVPAELADRLEKRQPLDVADRAADLADGTS
jgi:hypothetical protein